jgi:hypothetical protein
MALPGSPKKTIDYSLNEEMVGVDMSCRTSKKGLKMLSKASFVTKKKGRKKVIVKEFVLAKKRSRCGWSCVVRWGHCEHFAAWKEAGLKPNKRR